MRPMAQKGSHVLKSKLLNIFLSEKFENLGNPGILYKDYFHFNKNLLKMPFSISFSTFCEPIQKVRTKTWFLKEAACSEAVQ